MRLSPVIVSVVAVLALVIVLAVGGVVLQPPRALLTEASFSLPKITPNADGSDDVTIIRYTINRNARVTIGLKNEATGDAFAFRDAERRSMGSHAVEFSGVVNGFLRSGETVSGTIETRLIPDGTYEWIISAQADDGEIAQQSGGLEVANGDSVLPAITQLDVFPTLFSPNQDGIDDRMAINVYLAKQAELTVYLTAPERPIYYVTERNLGRDVTQGALVRQYDYDAGVDNNVTPPPDGEYTLVILAQDKVGQRTRRETTIRIKDGGLPNAEIVAQPTGRTVNWTTLVWQDGYFTDAQTPGALINLPTVVQSTQARLSFPHKDLLVFSLVVSNYGTTPIRTYGPWAGTVYSDTQTDGAMILPDDRNPYSGAWRVGIECERSGQSYPWRWALGSPDQLTKVERDGETLYYLMPGQKATVWGAIRMTTILRTRNPRKCYAGLIHQDVQIPFRQSTVDPIDVELLTR